MLDNTSSPNSSKEDNPLTMEVPWIVSCLHGHFNIWSVSTKTMVLYDVWSVVVEAWLGSAASSEPRSWGAWRVVTCKQKELRPSDGEGGGLTGHQGNTSSNIRQRWTSDINNACLIMDLFPGENRSSSWTVGSSLNELLQTNHTCVNMSKVVYNCFQLTIQLYRQVVSVPSETAPSLIQSDPVWS